VKQKIENILKRKLEYLEEAMEHTRRTTSEDRQRTIEYLSARRVLSSLFLCEDTPDVNPHERLQWFHKALTIGDLTWDKEIKSFLEQKIHDIEEEMLSSNEYKYRKKIRHKRKLRIPDE